MQRAIIDGKKVTGITTMFMANGMDTGDMLLKTEVEFFRQIILRICMIKWRWQAQHCFWKRLTDWKKGTITRMPQDDALATHAPMIHKETGHIDWSKGGQQIIDLMRGMYRTWRIRCSGRGTAQDVLGGGGNKSYPMRHLVKL